MKDELTKHERTILRCLILAGKRDLIERNKAIEEKNDPFSKATYQHNLEEIDELNAIYDKLWEEVCDVGEGCTAADIKKLGIPEGCIKLSVDDYHLIEQLIVQEHEKAYSAGWEAGHVEGYDKGYDDAKEIADSRIYG